MTFPSEEPREHMPGLRNITTRWSPTSGTLRAPRRLSANVRAAQGEDELGLIKSIYFAPQGAMSARRLCSLGCLVRGTVLAVGRSSAGIATTAVTSLGASGTGGGFAPQGTSP